MHSRGIGHDGGALESVETGNQEVLVTISSVDFIFEIGKSWEKAGEVVRGSRAAAAGGSGVGIGLGNQTT